LSLALYLNPASWFISFLQEDPRGGGDNGTARLDRRTKVRS
jgi:hypothetical protein